jgi:uncharacterized Zn-binding protein involved in type VI secretion
MFLKNKDGRMVIRLSDTTTHGGRVITSSDNWTVDGRPVARVGDMVMCPQCNNQAYPIVQGDGTITQDGRPVAFEGHLTACGARLISSLQGSQPAMQNAVYRPAQEPASATPAQHSYTDAGARQVDISDIRVHRSPIFRHRDPTDEVLRIMINNNSEGHAGFMIGEGKQSMLYDPSGSYTGCFVRECQNGDPTYRGSSDTLTPPYFDWGDYLAYQRSDGPKVTVYLFEIPQAQADAIRAAITNSEMGKYLRCATSVSKVLRESGGIFSDLSEPWFIRTPWGLEKELRDIMYPGSGGLISPAY